MDHLLDAVDTNGEVEIRLRPRREQRIQPGRWLVNCTGNFFRGEPFPYAPYVSGDGRVASISPTSAVALLSSFAGYFTSHLLMLDKLAELPLYELDTETLGRADRDPSASAPWSLYTCTTWR